MKKLFIECNPDLNFGRYGTVDDVFSVESMTKLICKSVLHCDPSGGFHWFKKTAYHLLPLQVWSSSYTRSE